MKLLARDPAEIERSNLVNICKLVVKELLEQSVRYGRMLDSDHLPLQHFFIVIEHVLGHGLRTKKVLPLTLLLNRLLYLLFHYCQLFFRAYWALEKNYGIFYNV